MGLSHVVHGLVTQAILGAGLVGLDIFLRAKQDFYEITYGTLGIVAAINLVVYLYVAKWNNVRTWWFYLTFVPVLLTSSFDLFSLIDMYLAPNGVFLKEYLSVKDPHLHNLYIWLFIVCDATLVHLINLVILYRTGNGRSGRSLLLFNSLALAIIAGLYATCALTSTRPVHILTRSFMVVGVLYYMFPLGPLSIPRGFKFAQNQRTGILTKLLGLFTAVLLLAAGAVFVAKALVLNGITNVAGVTELAEVLAIVKKNDPMIFLNDVEKTIPYAAVMIWTYVVVGLPIILASVFYQLKSNKPLLLWELSVFQAALIIPVQFFFIAGPLFWGTPKELKLSPSNPILWGFNLVPVVASIFQILSLLPYRVPSAPLTTRAQKSKKRA